MRKVEKGDELWGAVPLLGLAEGIWDAQGKVMQGQALHSALGYGEILEPRGHGAESVVSRDGTDSLIALQTGLGGLGVL